VYSSSSTAKAASEEKTCVRKCARNLSFLSGRAANGRLLSAMRLPDSRKNGNFRRLQVTSGGKVEHEGAARPSFNQNGDRGGLGSRGKSSLDTTAVGRRKTDVTWTATGNFPPLKQGKTGGNQRIVGRIELERLRPCCGTGRCRRLKLRDQNQKEDRKAEEKVKDLQVNFFASDALRFGQTRCEHRHRRWIL